ncbi:MAG: DUF4198 domain-containing protein [Zoogloeaceae bacterium]|jgi:nickel transport protein|nr:DUF4198 domain-containing protein [Zoogloeaceae bacterium]
MKFIQNAFLCAFVSLLLALALPTAAHDLWLEKEADGYVLLQGHRTTAHAGAERVPYPANFARQAVCADERGGVKPLAIAPGYPARLGDDCAARQVTASSGYWTKTAWETRNAPKAGIAGVLKSWRAEESVKYIERWSAALARPLATGLEITPVNDPFRLGVGDRLTVRVTLDGKPRPDVPVAYDGATRGASGEDGTVVLKIRHGGLQMIAASLETPLDDGQADTLIQAATLNFALPGK